MIRISMLKKISKLLSKKERFNAILLIFLMFIGMMLETLSIGLIVPTLALLLKGPVGLTEIQIFSDFNQFIIDNQENIVLYGISILVIVFFIKYIFLIFLTFLQYKFSSNLMHRLGNDILKSYMKRPYKFFINTNSSVLINNIIKQLDTFISQMIEPLLQLATEALVIFGITIFLIMYDFRSVFFISICLVMPSILFFFLVKKKSRSMGIAHQKYDELVLKSLSQAIGSIKEIKLFQKFSQFLQSFNFYFYNAVRIRRNRLFLLQLPRFWIEFFAIFSICMLVLFANSNEASDDIITIIGVFGVSALRMLPSLNKSIIYSQVITFGKKATETIFEQIDYKSFSEIDYEKSQHKIINKFKNLKVKYLSYGYKENSKILDKVSLSFNQGQKIGIIGKSGSGKSTLINILTGLLDPSEGSIVINDKFGLSINKFEWQSKLGYAPQNYHLLDDTIAKNVSLEISNSKIDYNLLNEIINICSLSDYINGLTKKLETNIGEIGSNISGGQKQRLVIARAIYSNPEILILDEATSALDVQTENQILKNLKLYRPNLTVLIISHRLETLYECDKLFEIKNKKIQQINL